MASPEHETHNTTSQDGIGTMGKTVHGQDKDEMRSNQAKDFNHEP
jgi:hypothetical protein